MLNKKRSCLCGSGLVYEECCLKKPNISTKQSMELLASTRKQYNDFKMDCVIFANGSACGNAPINSHNIQNKSILNKLQKDGHIFIIREKATSMDYTLDFMLVGVKNTTIFRCLCSYHDDVLFADIEKMPYVKSSKQNFQLAFKALLFVYWKENCGSKNLQTLISKFNIFENELGTGNYIRSTIDLLRIEYYFKLFSNLHQSNDFDNMESLVFSLDYEIKFAASVPLNIVRHFNGNPFNSPKRKDKFTLVDGKLCLMEDKPAFPFIFVSVFPQDGKSFIVVSWLKSDNDFYESIAEEIKSMTSKGITQLFNVLLPLCAENIVISPNLIDNWNDKQRKEFLALSHPNSLDFYYQNSVDVVAWSNQISYDLFAK